ncbi:MAG: XRE family transcriptional regulator, partial [Oxalobacteraceae bacterium]
MPLIVLQPVDTYLGQRLRLKRRDQWLSQQALAVRIAMSAQQIEKYKSGANRISASRLFEIAQALSTPVAWFFEGAPK